MNPANTPGVYDFVMTEDAVKADEIKIAQANEYAASVLLKDNRLVSRYLERGTNSQFKINLVDLEIPLSDGLEVTDFYFDQVLLVLQIRDNDSGLQKLQFFNYFQENYLHLDMIESDSQRDSRLVVDDRLSNLQYYTVVRIGYSATDQLEL